MVQKIDGATPTWARPLIKKRQMVMIVTIILTLGVFYGVFHQSKSPYTTTHKLTLPEIDTNNPEDEEEDAALDHNWKRVRPKSGDSLASLFKHLNISPKTLQAILNDNPHNKALTQIKPNQELQFLIQNQQLEKLIIPVSPTQSFVVTHQQGHYPGVIKARAMTSHQQLITATVKGSLFGTAQQMGIPAKLMRQMMSILSRDINFARDVRSGDQFSMLYNAFYIEDKQVDVGDIMAVRYIHQGQTHQAIRHQNQHGGFDYYSLDGTSLKKAFTRYPVRFSHISSTFSLSRMHPVLHYARPHYGIDLAAPIGTPIYATGDGRIEHIGRQGGYGNMIKIVHDRTYTTLYGHMLKFQKGLSRGSHVKRGQLIGFVGQSGLASGPHCHYEVHFNRRPKNPATISLPTAAPIPAREMAVFRAQANMLLARLKLFEDGYRLASNRPMTDG